MWIFSKDNWNGSTWPFSIGSLLRPTLWTEESGGGDTGSGGGPEKPWSVVFMAEFLSQVQEFNTAILVRTWQSANGIIIKYKLEMVCSWSACQVITHNLPNVSYAIVYGYLKFLLK